MHLLDNAVYIVGWAGISIWVGIWAWLLIKYIIKVVKKSHDHHLNNISFH